MTRNEIIRRFPKASEAFIRANLSAGDTVPRAVVERPARHEPLATNQGEEGATGSVLIRFVVTRKRCLDPDNVAVKWLLDALRYSGFIQGDEPEKVSLEIKQQKGEPEQVVVEVFKLIGNACTSAR